MKKGIDVPGDIIWGTRSTTGKASDRKRVLYVTKEEHDLINQFLTAKASEQVEGEFLHRLEIAGVVGKRHAGKLVRSIDWKRFHLVAIERRPIKPVPRELLAVIHAIMNDEFLFPETGLYAALGAWAFQRSGGVQTPESLRVRLLGYRPNEPSQGWGVIYQIRDGYGKTVEYAVAVPEFTAYTFIAREEDSVEPPATSSTERSAFVLEDDDERDILRALLKTKHEKAVSEVTELEQELAASEGRIASLESEIKNLTP